MGLFDDFYNNKPVLPTGALPQIQFSTPAPVDPFTALLTHFLTQPQQGKQQGGGIPWHELIQSTLPGAGDVQGMANKLSQLPSYMPGSMSPFNTGFFDVNRSSFGLTPEAKLASQGPSAQTQWGALGGVIGVNASVLKNLLKQSPGSY